MSRVSGVGDINGLNDPVRILLPWETKVHQQRKDGLYYLKCLAGGIVSSSVRWVSTPFDAVKCNMQVNPSKYPTFASGLATVFRENGMAGLYKGFLPTVLAYSSQTGTKYMMYEIIKDSLSKNDQARQYSSFIYIVSAGISEAIADVLMCPWEMLKVRMQTSSNFPTQFGPALAAMIQHRKEFRFPFGSLGPLWSRQILSTIMNFYTFEHTVDGIYEYVLAKDKSSCPRSTQLMVTLVSGYMAGFVSSIVSHPADSLISLKSRNPHKSIGQIVDEVGWRKLAMQGLMPRMILTGSVIGLQWFVYDSFKTIMGMETTGGILTESI